MHSEDKMNGHQRGQMRPYHTSRTPSFVVVGLLVVIAILGFNYWNVSSKNNTLSEELHELSERLRLTSVRKLAVEKRNEVLIQQHHEISTEIDRHKSLASRKEEEMNSLNSRLNAKLDEMETKQADLDKCTQDLEMCSQNYQDARVKMEACCEEKDICNAKVKEAEECETALKQAEETVGKSRETGCTDEIKAERQHILQTVQKIYGSKVLETLRQANIDISGIQLDSVVTNGDQLHNENAIQGTQQSSQFGKQLASQGHMPEKPSNDNLQQNYQQTELDQRSQPSVDPDRNELSLSESNVNLNQIKPNLEPHGELADKVQGQQQLSVATRSVPQQNLPVNTQQNSTVSGQINYSQQNSLQVTLQNSTLQKQNSTLYDQQNKAVQNQQNKPIDKQQNPIVQDQQNKAMQGQQNIAVDDQQNIAVDDQQNSPVHGQQNPLNVAHGNTEANKQYEGFNVNNPQSQTMWNQQNPAPNQYQQPKKNLLVPDQSSLGDSEKNAPKGIVTGDQADQTLSEPKPTNLLGQNEPGVQQMTSRILIQNELGAGRDTGDQEVPDNELDQESLFDQNVREHDADIRLGAKDLEEAEESLDKVQKHMEEQEMKMHEEDFNQEQQGMQPQLV